jgi:hypothetical protein
MAEKDNKDTQKTKLLWNIFASGLSSDSNLDVIRKHFLHNLIGIFGALFLGFFSAIAVFQSEYILALADFTLLLVVLTLVFTLRTRKNPRIISLFGTLITGFFYLFLIFYSGMGKPTFHLQIRIWNI